MTLTVHRLGSVTALAIVLGLLGFLSRSEPSVQGQPDCTVIVQPGQSIQQAVNSAAEGAVICLSAGTWEENVEIKKSLTLRGAGREESKIKGKEMGEPVIAIESDTEIEVKIEGLAVTEAKGLDFTFGIWLAGKAKAVITDSTISDNGLRGIVLGDSAQATISDSTISGNGWAGIELLGSAKLTLQKSTVQGNGTGLRLLPKA